MSTLEQKVWEKNKKQLLQQNKHLHAELHRLQQEIELLEAERQEEAKETGKQQDAMARAIKMQLAGQEKQMKQLKELLESTRNQNPVENAMYIKREENELTVLKRELKELQVERQLVTDGLARKQQTLATNQPLQLHKDDIQNQWATTKKQNREMSLKIVEMERQERKLFAMAKQSKEEGRTTTPTSSEAKLIELERELESKREQLKRKEGQWKPNLEVLDQDYFTNTSTLNSAQAKLTQLQKDEAVWRTRAAALRGHQQLETDKMRLSKLPQSKTFQAEEKKAAKTPPKRQTKTSEPKPPPVHIDIPPKHAHQEVEQPKRAFPPASPKKSQQINKPASPKKALQIKQKVQPLSPKKAQLQAPQSPKRTNSKAPLSPKGKDVKQPSSPKKSESKTKDPNSASLKKLTESPQVKTKIDKVQSQKTVPTNARKKQQKQLPRSASIKSPLKKEKIDQLPVQSVIEINQNASTHARRREKAKQGRSQASEGLTLAEQIRQKVEQAKKINSAMEKQQRKEQNVRSSSPSPPSSPVRAEVQQSKGKTNTLTTSTPAMPKTGKLQAATKIPLAAQLRKEMAKSSDRYQAKEKSLPRQRIQSINLQSISKKSKQAKVDKAAQIKKLVDTLKAPPRTSSPKRQKAAKTPRAKPSPPLPLKLPEPVKMEKNGSEVSGGGSPRFNIIMSDAVRGVVEDESEGVVRVVKRKRVKGVVSTSTATAD